MSLVRWFNRRNKKRIEAAAKRQRKVLFEPIEPRILLSADLNTSGVAAALSDGLDRFGDRFQGLLGAERIDGADSLLDTRMPIILQTENEGETTERSFSPTIGQLGSVPSDVDPELNDLVGDGMVDLGEMVQSLLFEKVEDFLDDPNRTGSLTDFMDNNLDVSIPLGPDTQIRFQVLSVTDNTDNTAGNEAELSFDADFFLTVSDDLLIDFGPEADDLGLEILQEPEYELRVDTSLGFGFAFGVRTAGQETIDADDFFIRQPDDAVVNVTAGEKVAPIVAESAAPLDYEDEDAFGDSFSVNVKREGSGDFSKDVVVQDNASFPDLASLVEYLNSQLDNNNDSPVEFAAFGSDKLQLSPVDPQVTEVTLTDAGFLGFSSDEIVAMEPEANFDLNVGFLGTEVREGTITIDAGVISRFIDPNEPSVLGFVEPFIDPMDGGVLADPDGNLAAAEAPGELVLSDEDGAGFFLRIGRGGVATEVIVPQSATTDNTTLEHLRSDVQDALDAAGLGDLITAGTSDSKLTLSLPDADPGALGFDKDQFDSSGSLAALEEPNGDGEDKFKFTEDVNFLLSVDGALPKVVTLLAVDTTGNTSIDDLVDDANSALSSAGVTDVTASATLDGKKVQLDTTGASTDKSLELPCSLTYDAVLTFTELDPGITSADELFEMESDTASKITLDLPVSVKPGLKKPDLNPFAPAGVSIEASFDPFTVPVVERDDRLGLLLKQDATPADQDIDKLNMVNFEDGDVVPDGTDLINFTRMSANNVIGLLVQLQGMLDSLPQTDMFAMVDIPFARAALGQTLDFGDLFGDAILFDDEDDEDPDTYVNKLLKKQDDSLVISFATAQELGSRFEEIFTNSNSINPTYNPDTDELTYDLPQLSDDFGEQTVPIDLSLDLAPLEGLGSESEVTLGADGILGMILGFDLADRDRLDLDTPLSDLNNGRGVDIKPEPAVTGAGDARAIYGVLDEDVGFTVEINDGSEVTVVIKAADTDDNLTLADLAADIDAAMDSALGANQIDVTVQPVSDDADAQPRILFKAIDSSVTSFVLSAQGGAGSQLGFGVDDGAVASIFGTADIIGSARLNDPAGFTLSVNGEAAKTVTVPASDPSVVTSSADDLVLAVNDAIVEAGFKNANDQPTVRAMRVESRLALVAADSSVSTFTVNANSNDPAVSDLGLAAGATSSDLIVLSNTIAPVVGRLTDSATFTANVTTTDRDVVGTVTILAEDTSENRTIFDLSQNVNFALAEAESAGDTIELSRFLLAENDGGRLVLTARQPFLTTDPAPSLYRLSETAAFWLIITTTDGSGETTTSTQVTVAASDTTDINSLVDSINVALQDQGLNSQVVADSIPVNDENGDSVGARITLTVIDPAITEVRLSTDADDPMASELSFNTSQLAALSVIGAGDVIPDAQLTGDAMFGLGITIDDGEGGVSTTSATVTVPKTSTILSLIGATNAPVFYQLPDADATFTLDIESTNPDKCVTGVDVVVEKTRTAGNSTLADLVADVNSALDDARLNDRIVAGTDGSLLTLRAVDSDVTSFTLTAAADDPAVTVLGFGMSQTSQTSDDDETLVAVNAVTPIVGRTTADAEFDIEITQDDGTTTNATVAVTEADTGDNSIIEDLVTDLNAALDAAGVNGLVAAGHLGERLTLSAVDGSHVTAFKVTAAADDPAVTELGLPADESATANGSIDDLVADVNSGLGTAQLADGTLIDLRGQVVAEEAGSRIMLRVVDGSVLMFEVKDANTVAVDELGLPSAQTQAGLRLVATDSVVPVNGRLVSDAPFDVELINRNGSTEVKTVTMTSAPALTGAADATTTGTLSNDAEFAVVLELADGNLDAATVTVEAGTDLSNLAAELNTALADAKDSAGDTVDLTDRLYAEVVDSRVVFHATDSCVTGFSVVSEEDTPAVTELGLGPFQVSSGRASDNAGLSDIAADINRALIVADLGEKLAARIRNDRVELRLLDSTYSGFTVTAAGPAVDDLGFAASKDATRVSGFTISADTNDPAVTELGLFDETSPTPRTASAADFVITTGDGESHPVSLAGLLTLSAPTVGNLLNTIDAQTGADVEAEINDARDGFKLTDLETADDPGTATDLFRVDTINASAAAFHLGIFGADISLVGEPPDGVIHGDTTSVEDISTRLFLRDATLGGTVSVTPGPELQGDGDPPEVDITGNFGFVGVRLTGQRDTAGSEHAIDIAGSFSTDFKVFDPDDETGPIQPRLTLAELTDGVINDIASVLEYPDIVGSGTITLDVALNPAAEGGLFDELLPPEDRIVTINFEDFGKPYELAGPVPAAVSVDAPDLEKLEKFEKIRYGDVLGALDLVGEFLGAFETAGFLGEKLFVIDKSISSLLSTADMYDRALLLAKGSDTQAIQGLEQAFKDAFGLGEDATFELNLVEDDETDYLKFNMKYEAVLNKALGVNLDLTHDVKIGHLVPPNFQVGSVLKGVGSSEITLSFGIDLNEPERVVLFDDLALSGSLEVLGDFTQCGSLGGETLQDGRSPACICFNVKDGSAELRTDYDFGPKEDFGSLNADFAVLAEPNDDGTLTSEIFGEDGSLNTGLFEGGPKDIGTEVDVTLPLYYPGSENKDYIGVITATGNIDSADDIPVPRDLALSVPAELATLPFAKRGLFDNIVLLVDLVDMALLGLQEALDTEVFNMELPLIGDRLSEGAQVIEDFRVGFVRDFRDGLASALNPSDNLIAELLFDGLGPNGANLLFDRVNADPMVINPDTDALGNPIPSDFELLGRLTGDVLFDLILNDEDPVTVTLNASDTTDNVSIDDLVEDMNNALVVAGLDDRLEAIGLGRALGLRALSSKADFNDPDALSKLKIEENQGNLSGLGFQGGDTAVFVGTALTLTGTEVVTTEILPDTDFDESRLGFENLTNPGAFISMDCYKDADPDTGAVTGDVLKWRMRLGQTLPLSDTTDFDFDLGFPGLGLDADGALDVSLNWTFDFGFGLSEEEGVFLDLIPTIDILSRMEDPHFQAFLWVAPVSGSSLTGKLAGLQLDIVAQNPPGEISVPNNLNATFGFNIINRKDPSAERLGITDFGKFGIKKPTISASTNLRLGLTLGLDSDLLGDTAAFFPEITSNFVLDWSITRPLDKTEAKFSLLLDRGTTLENVPISVDVSELTKIAAAEMPAELVKRVNVGLKQAGLAGDSKTDAKTRVWAEVAGLTGTKLKLTAQDAAIESIKLTTDPGDPAVKIIGFTAEQAVERSAAESSVVLIAQNNVSGGDNKKSLLAEGLEKVQFNLVSLNLGQFLSDVVAPYLDEIQMITRPIQPIVNVLTTPIPVISDLAGRSIRMIDLAGTFGKVDPSFLSAMGRLITAINKVPSNPDEVILNFGDFTIYPSTPDINATFLTDTNVKLAESGIQNTQKNYDFDSQIKGTSSSSSTASFAKQLRGGAFGDFKLPILTDPSQVFNIILGRTADLIALDLPPLVLQFAYKQSFPIDALPLAAFIRGTASATIDFAFGFDTFGILQAAKTDFRNPFLIADGFYVNDLNPFGQDVPELCFGLSLSAGAEISMAVASAGVEGGLFATVDFDLFDPNQDGKVRISEMLNTMDFQSRSDKAYLTPLSIFDVSGKVEARLFAFIEALFGAFRKEFNIVPPITIVDFEIPFAREPILATELGDGVLQLNMGPNADQRLNGNTEDGAEKFYVKQDSDNHVKVWAPDMGVNEGNAQKYEANSLIIAQGGKFNDMIDLSRVTDHDISFEIEGDEGNDEIYIGTGPATVEGNVGNDIIYGGAGNDIIFGNEGNDTIKGFGGDDIIFGDDGNISDKIVSASIGDDGDDIIEGGTGMDLIFGGGGSDTIKGNDEADLVLGDGGRVMFENEENTPDEDKLKLDLDNDNEIDLVVQVTEFGIEIDDDESRVKVLGTEFGEGGTDIISGGAGPDILYGGAAGDDIFGQAGDDLIFGGKGFDTIRGGAGGDTVSGGRDNDTIFGFSDNPLDGIPAVDDGADVLFGDEGCDIIRGQGGADTIHGGIGGDILLGDEDDDELVAGDGADIVFGGPGNDTLDGGFEADILFGDDGLVATLGNNDDDNNWFPMQPTVDADGNEIFVEDRADGVRGNTSNGVNPDEHENDVKDEDLLIGLGDPSLLLTGLVHDQDGKTRDLIVTAVALTDGDDVITGNGDNDVLLGGNGNDRLGGDVDPRLDRVSPFTPAGEDVLIGDGGRIEFYDGCQTSIASIVGTAGDDVLYGDNGDDIGLGGGGADHVFGGFGAVVDTNGTLGESRGRTDPAAGDKDVLFGDNGELLFTTEFSTRVERDRDDTADIYLDIKTGTVISEIRSTDISNETGGADTVEGGVDDDVIIGGVNGLTLTDRDTLRGGVGNDVIVGDNGRLDFAADGDLRTLDLIESTHLDIGAEDEIFGDLDNDIVIGGAAGDVITGDTGNDVMLGDNGQIQYQAGAAVTQLGLEPEQESSAELTLTATDAVSIINGRLSSDAVMNVSVTLRDGSVESKTMTVLKESTFENEDMDDLEFSLVDALFQADLQDLLQVEINDDGYVVFSATDRPVESFEIEIQADDNPAVTELGLAAEGQVSISAPHMLTAENPARFVGQLSGDATFQVSVNGDPAVSVVVPQTAALDNATVSSLVKDINDALDAAGLGDQVVAGNNGKMITLSAADQSVRAIEVTAGAGNPAVTDLGFATTASTGLAVVGESPVRPVLGRLPGDAQFDLAITSNGEDYTATVTLTKTSTDENDSLSDLVDDLNDALDDALANAQDSTGDTVDLSGKIEADRDGSRIVLRGTDTSVTAFDLTANPDNPSITTLGLDEAQSAEGSPFVSLTGVNDVTPVFGRLTTDAVFVVTIDNGTPVMVTVTKASTNENTTIGELADDINLALSSTSLVNRIEAESTNGQIALRVIDNSIQEMSVTADADNPAVKQMGLGTDQAAVNLPLVAENQLSELAGRLTQNAVIEITVTDGDTTTTETAVVLAVDTANNNDVADLAADLDLALARAGLDDLIEAGADDSDHIVLTAKNTGIDLIEVRALPQLIDEIVTTDTLAATGGSDTIAGDLGDDIAIGGAVGDIMSGDDGNDVMLGDSAQLLFSNGTIERIRTIDTNNDVGGGDTIEGNADTDVILGGVFGDDLYGDAATSGDDDGADVILGDNGQLDVDDIDNIPGTIDLEYIRIKTTDFNLGGVDDIFGNAGDDIAMGGSYGDNIIGDNSESVPGSGVFDELEPNPGDDILIGDQGQMDFFNGLVTQIETTDTAEADGGVDYIQGNDLADFIVGGVAGDELHGEAELVNGLGITDLVDTAGDDVIVGDEGLLRYDVASTPGIFIDSLQVAGDDDPYTLDIIQTKDTGVLGADDDIYGNGGSDVVLGGSDGDDIYGDFYLGSLIAALNPGEDVLLGDGGEMTFIDTDVTVIWTIEPSEGGSDTIQGNDLSDVIMGGQAGDALYGEAPEGDLCLIASSAGDDYILGDNGRIDYILAEDTIEGRPDVTAHLGGTTVSLDADPSNLDRVTTTDPTLGGNDLIFGNAGSDTIFGGTAVDTIRGDTSDDGPGPDGTDGIDLIFGDHGKIYPTLPSVDSFFLNNNFFSIDTLLADLGDGDVIFGNANHDIMIGGTGDDVMIGGTGDDDMIGGHNVEGGDDDLDPMPSADQLAIDPVALADLNPADVNEINDIMAGGQDDDVMAGDNAYIIRQPYGAQPNALASPRFRMAGENGLAYSFVSNDLEGLADVDVGFAANVTSDFQPHQDMILVRTVVLLDHDEAAQDAAVAAPAAPRPFGNDVMAGSINDDEMFGQLGDDIIQGDGEIEMIVPAKDLAAFDPYDPAQDADPSFDVRNVHILASLSSGTDTTLRFSVFETLYDGDDYVEGNGGNDRMYGNLGQDDLIGGSSTLFGLSENSDRPDGADLIYGGAGNPDLLARNASFGGENDISGNTLVPADMRHAFDADTILGDNGDIYRLVTDDSGEIVYESFNYDRNATLPNGFVDDGYSDTLTIRPRAMNMVDYGYEYADDEDPAATRDVLTFLASAQGEGDLIYGESGDDVMHGMTGNDVIFGNSEDDDLYGEIGTDFLLGGTGRDGIVGDDGLILTSRNVEKNNPNDTALSEPLYGISKLDDVNVEISTPGNIQRAIINVEDEIIKAVELFAFRTDDLDGQTIGEFDDALRFNDIAFGGQDNDFIHAGDGDDAVSGAEALPAYYSGEGFGFNTVNTFLQTQQNAPINDDPDLADNPFWFDFAPYNPGDILRYEGNTLPDPDDPHGKTRQELALYNEFFPRRKVMLDANGEAVDKEIDALYDFLLNFDETEGPDGYPFGADPEPLPTDGDDRIFGDLGNDWMVGGTGRDRMYGGRGDDLLNMDDNHDSGPGGKVGPHDPPPDPLDNTKPDEYQAYADITYAGAGRDVLILNTRADRAIDWVGEYNSYIVPFSPFGAFPISRTLQPQLPEFLCALSSSDGADVRADALKTNNTVDAQLYVDQKTLDDRVDDPDPLRNYEPYGELGIVCQTDFDWQEQTGAPSDPQPGNLSGPREIMRSELFTDPEAPNSFAADVGTWRFADGRYAAAPAVAGGEAVSVYHLDQFQPSYMEILVTVNMDKVVEELYCFNAYIIFDMQSNENFKFAGVDQQRNKLQIGHHTDGSWVIDTESNIILKPNTDYDLFVALHGTVAILYVDLNKNVSFDFGDPLNDGYIGLGTDNSVARFDDWQVQKLLPENTFEFPEDFSDTTTNPFVAQMGDWQVTDGRYIGAVSDGDRAITTWSLDVAPSSKLEFEALIETGSLGGLVFDYYGPKDFKFAAIQADTDQVVIGHHTSKGWFINDSADASIETGTSYNLGISMLGTSVSVTLNGQAVVGHVFNSLLVDGFIGLLSKDGATLFDDVVARGDDPAYAENEPDSFLIYDVLGESITAYAVSGVFEVKNGVLAVTAESIGGNAVAFFDLDDYLPSYFEVAATLTMEKPIGGWKANSYIIIDYQNEYDFKFAGIDASRDKIQLGHRTADGWIIDAETPAKIKPGVYYNMLVAVNGTNVTVVVDGAEYFSHTYEARVDEDGWVYGINDGMVGLCSNNSRGTFDNIALQVLPPELTFEGTEEFPDTDDTIGFTTVTGLWQPNGDRYDGRLAVGSDTTISLVDLGLEHGLEVASILELEATLSTEAIGGTVFDYDQGNFKFAAIDAVADQVVIGHYTDKSGWVCDAMFDTTIEDGVDYDIALSLKGATVNLSVKESGAEDWQAMVGHLFNAVTVDGEFGLLSKDGGTSFDAVTVKTDDPAFRDEADNLMASAAPQGPVDADSVLTYDELALIVDEALDRWTDALGIDGALLSSLHEVSFQIVDFSDLTLGRAFEDTILIDADAVGYGWFVDTTPYDDVEFSRLNEEGELVADSASDAYGDMDLLTVVMHELGHVLGLEDLDPDTHDLMSETLDAGVRKLADDYIDADSVEVNEADDLASLVVMDTAINEAEAIAPAPAKHGSSWLTEFLTNGTGKRYNKFNPKDDIKIVVFDDDEENDLGINKEI